MAEVTLSSIGYSGRSLVLWPNCCGREIRIRYIKSESGGVIDTSYMSIEFHQLFRCHPFMSVKERSKERFFFEYFIYIKSNCKCTHSQVLTYTHARIPEKNCIGALTTATAAHSAAIDCNDQLLIEDTYYYTCDIFKSLHSIN